MNERKLTKGKPITEPLLLQLMRPSRYADIEQNKEDQVLAFVREADAHPHPFKTQFRSGSNPVTIEFAPQKINIPEPEAFLIASTICLVHTQQIIKLYLLKNGEWQGHAIEPLMAKIIEHLYRWSAWPANRRGRKVSEMRELCNAKNHRSSDSTISTRINRIEQFCLWNNIPPLIVQGEDKRWYFNPIRV